MWWLMRSLLSWSSDWVVVHPVLWGVGCAVVLVLIGLALQLPPIVILAAGATVGAQHRACETTGLLPAPGAARAR